MRPILSTVVGLLMGITAYFGSLTLQCPLLWLLYVSPRTFRTCIDFTMYMWTSCVATFMECFMGIRFRLYGDRINPKERAIFIMNHRTRLDWLYFYGILLRFGFSLGEEKIILKDELKKIPGAGWAMQCADYIFLRRKLNRDICHLTNIIQYFCREDHKTKILIFPEGTDFSDYSVNKSNQYADKNGLPHYNYVLHPRINGFSHVIQEMVTHSAGSSQGFDAIYDITVAYPEKNFATNELGFLIGKSSPEVHFLCRRYSLRNILKISQTASADEVLKLNLPTHLKTFISKKWEEKEHVLKDYYLQNANIPNRGFPLDEVDLNDLDLPGFLFLKRIISVVVICGNTFLGIFLLSFYPRFYLPIYAVLNLIFILLNIFHDGVDDFILRKSLNRNYQEYNAAVSETSVSDSSSTFDKLSKVD